MADRVFSNSSSRRAPVILALCTLITAGVLAIYWLHYLPLNGALRDAENYVQDRFTRLGPKVPPDPRLVLIGIDRPSYEDAILPEEALADPVLAAIRERW